MPPGYRRRLISVVLFHALVLPLCSCTHLPRADREALAGQWRAHMESRTYGRALDVYASAVRRYPGDKELQNLYVRAAENLKDLGERAFKNGEFGQAERIYGALLGAYRGFEGLRVRPSFSSTELRERRMLARIRGIEAAAKLQLGAGEYRSGLDILRNAYRDLGRETQFLRVYAGAVEEVKQCAESAFAEKDFFTAGRVSDMLLRDFSSFASFEKDLSFGRQSLVARINDCSASLTRKGLELYRQGKIAEAIAVWEKILAFNNNPDIRRMIETATEQRKRLQR